MKHNGTAKHENIPLYFWAMSNLDAVTDSAGIFLQVEYVLAADYKAVSSSHKLKSKYPIVITCTECFFCQQIQVIAVYMN